MRPRPEIILFGVEEGTAEICQELGLRYIPEVVRNKFGTPLVSDLFKKAQNLATYDLICYINADIIIVTQNLIQAVNIVQQRWERFVILCSRWELFMINEIDFSFPGWQEQFRNLVKENAKAPLSIGIDLFLFPRGFYRHIPPFGLGRKHWDNWLIFKSRSEKIPLIDASQFMFIVHPVHERSAENDSHTSYEEIRINQRLISWWARTFIGLDATYNLEENGQLRKKQTLELLQPRIKAITLCYLINRPWQVICYFQRKIIFLLRKTKILKYKV